VTRHTREHLSEAYLIRTALESLAARLAVERASEDKHQELFQRMEELTTHMGKAHAAGDMREHEALLVAMGSKDPEQVASAIRSHLMAAQRTLAAIELGVREPDQAAAS
jgi:DNA-binding GntR family transcriptional regulator